MQHLHFRMLRHEQKYKYLVFSVMLWSVHIHV